MLRNDVGIAEDLMGPATNERHCQTLAKIVAGGHLLDHKFAEMPDMRPPQNGCQEKPHGTANRV